MAIAIAFQEVPDLAGRVFQPGDISISDGGNAVTIPLNRNGDIREIGAALKQFQINVRGLTGVEVEALTVVKDDNLLDLLQGNNPTFRTIEFSGQSYPNCYLRSVTPSGSTNVGGIEVIESVTLVYETADRYLT